MGYAIRRSSVILCFPLLLAASAPCAAELSDSELATFRKELKARADLTVRRLRAMPGVTCVPPAAAFYAMPRIALPPGRTDEHYVKALLHATGVLCVYGSGFGLPAEEGFLRIVFLAPLNELTEIYDLMSSFTAQYFS